MQKIQESNNYMKSKALSISACLLSACPIPNSYSTQYVYIHGKQVQIFSEKQAQISNVSHPAEIVTEDHKQNIPEAETPQQDNYGSVD